MRHNLEYLAKLIENLEKTKIVLEYLYYEKASECPYVVKKEDMFLPFCSHPQVNKGINPQTDCRHCPYYPVSEELPDLLSKGVAVE